MNTPAVDGVSAAQILAKIEERNPDKRLIHVIWDNAAYHKGPDVRECPTSSFLPHVRMFRARNIPKSSLALQKDGRFRTFSSDDTSALAITKHASAIAPAGVGSPI